MSDHIRLVGTEAVEAAARQMSGAAEEMRRAMIDLEGSLQRQREFMANWLQDLQAILERTR